jgi:hypothetical protein
MSSEKFDAPAVVTLEKCDAPEHDPGFQKFVDENRLSKDMPAIMFSWRDASMLEIVGSMNAYAGVFPPPPFLILSQAPTMTTETFKADIINAITVAGGGRHHGNVMVALQTVTQYANAHRRLAQLDYDPYLQANMANVTAGAFLAEIFDVLDKNPSKGTPTNVLPPAVGRQLFE